MDFGKSILGNYEAGTEREYIITNGYGSFSSGCINGNLSRRYHGLMVASFLPPLDRFLVLHKIDEEIEGISIAVNKVQKDGPEIEKGYLHLDHFSLKPFPKFIYSINGIFIEKEIFMVYEQNTVVITYKILFSVKKAVQAKFNLYFNYRDFHLMGELEEETQYITKKKENCLEVKPDVPGAKPVYIYSNGINNFVEEQKIKQNIMYDNEINERGDTKLDNSFQAGYIEKELQEGETFYIIGSMDCLTNADVNELRNNEIERLGFLQDKLSHNDKYLRDLAAAADNFIVYRAGTKGKTIIAGYPWFGDWGRDTMIALPGLTLATGRYEDAKSILSTFSKYCSEGMLPNKFPDRDGEILLYNTIDASLWYFYAVHKYIEYTDDYGFVKNELFSSLQQIIEYHIKGTRYNIKVDENDGMIYGGDPTTQLTWMDVCFEGWAVTPRYGKAVEINALWYNALKVMEELSAKFGEDSAVYASYSDKAARNFEAIFWNEKDGCLFDYIAGKEKNDDIRPNQIFAVSLPYTMLSKEKAGKVINKVMEKLYTAHGLKSLSQDNEKYIGIYKGTLFQRDSCYHQGTVWSWPIGHLATAYNKIFADKGKIKLLLQGMKDHFYQEGCIRNISEIFDGDSPNIARGCFAQAWSVGEVIRVLKEEIGEI